jgi:hypothetical protein
MHLISYTLPLPHHFGLYCIFQAQTGFHDEISSRNEVLCYCELEYF